MRRAVHVRVLARIEMREPVDHGLRLLRGGGVVEPDERPAVDISLQDREIAAEDMRVELARSRDRRQSKLRAMLRRQRAEIERLTGQAIGQGRRLRGRAQALVEEIIAFAWVGGAETRSDQRFTCIRCGRRWRAGEADRSDGVNWSRRPSWPRRRRRRRDKWLGRIDGSRRQCCAGYAVGNAAVERRNDRHGAAKRARQRREVGVAGKRGLRISNRDVSGACGRDGDSRHRRSGRPLFPRRRDRLGWRRLALRGQRFKSVDVRCGPARARSRNSARSRGQIG